MQRWLTVTVLAAAAVTALACGLSGDAPAKGAKRARRVPAAMPPAEAPAPDSTPKHRAAPPLPAKPPVTKGNVTIKVLPDGSFEPRAVTIREGATVTWELSDPYRQSIAPLEDADGDPCTRIDRYTGGADDITGPMPRNPSGVFVLNQDGPGYVLGPDGKGEASGPLGGVTDASWASDRNVGAFLRLRWNWLQPDGEGKYDWTVLDQQVEKAVANGKLFSVGVKAGFHGTPDWIFDAGVDKLVFREFGSHEGTEDCKCGAFMTLGNPTQERYQELYFDMLEAMAKHLKSNAAWYRHLAYVKPSGANLYTVENRLPKRCTCASMCPGDTCPVSKANEDAPYLDSSGRICNTKVWAEAGYTPEGLMRFYARQFDLLASSFPEKDLAFLLIHDGFPRVGDKSHYLTCGDDAKDVPGVPPPVMQTKKILERGWKDHAERFTIQHAGLRATKDANYLLRKGRQPTQFIALQTTNDVTNASKLAEVLEHGMRTTDAVFYEVYEEGALDADRKGGPDFNMKLHKLRQASAVGNGPRRDPFPSTHAHTFQKAGATHVLNPSTCHTSTPATGVIYVE